MASDRLGRLHRILNAVRDAWAIVGLSLLAVLAVEAGYRLQASVRHHLRESSARERSVAKPAHPNAAELWWQAAETTMVPRQARREPYRYDPYRGWWLNPMFSPRATIDSAGFRVTPQPSVTAERKRLVFAFGGSTMWGFQSADSATIPAQIAKRLHERGVDDVQVVNFAQSAYNVTQGAISLLLELRRGHIPQLVVFLDGNNDVAAALFSGAGQIMNQGRAEEAFRLGRRSFAEELIGLGRHSELVTRLRQVAQPARPRDSARTSSAELCDSVATYYRNLVLIVEGLGREFGFSVLFFWQPLLANSAKPLTPWEASITSPGRFRETTRLCRERVDLLLKDRLGKTYFPLHSVFDAETISVFLDAYGHVTERGNAVIADSMITPIMARLSPPGPKRPSNSP